MRSISKSDGSAVLRNIWARLRSDSKVRILNKNIILRAIQFYMSVPKDDMFTAQNLQEFIRKQRLTIASDSVLRFSRKPAPSPKRGYMVTVKQCESAIEFVKYGLVLNREDDILDYIKSDGRLNRELILQNAREYLKRSMGVRSGGGVGFSKASKNRVAPGPAAAPAPPPLQNLVNTGYQQHLQEYHAQQLAIYNHMVQQQYNNWMQSQAAAQCAAPARYAQHAAPYKPLSANYTAHRYTPPAAHQTSLSARAPAALPTFSTTRQARRLTPLEPALYAIKEPQTLPGQPSRKTPSPKPSSPKSLRRVSTSPKYTESSLSPLITDPAAKELAYLPPEILNKIIGHAYQENIPLKNVSEANKQFYDMSMGMVTQQNESNFVQKFSDFLCSILDREGVQLSISFYSHKTQKEELVNITIYYERNRNYMIYNNVKDFYLNDYDEDMLNGSWKSFNSFGSGDTKFESEELIIDVQIDGKKSEYFHKFNFEEMAKLPVRELVEMKADAFSQLEDKCITPEDEVCKQAAKYIYRNLLKPIERFVVWSCDSSRTYYESLSNNTGLQSGIFGVADETHKKNIEKFEQLIKDKDEAEKKLSAAMGQLNKLGYESCYGEPYKNTDPADRGRIDALAKQVEELQKEWNRRHGAYFDHMYKTMPDDFDRIQNVRRERFDKMIEALKHERS